MKLNELLEFNHIVIQCHDNPDADAIASGYGIYSYLRANGRQARLIYGGREPVKKSNLTLMVEMLDIPIEYVRELEEPGLQIWGEKRPTLSGRDSCGHRPPQGAHGGASGHGGSP